MNKPSIATLMVILCGVGAATAQEARPPSKDVVGTQDVALTPTQMLEKVNVYIPQMDGVRSTVTEQLSEAKKRKDIVKALCLDDKVKQMKLATDTAKDRATGLAAAVRQQDSDRSKHEFTVIQVLRERVQTLVAEAQQCIGEETGFIGGSNVTVDVDSAIPEVEPSASPDDPLVSEPPVVSSPTY